MTRQTFATHFETLLRYWERARSDDGSGFNCWIGPDGSVRSFAYRPLVIQARLLYNYAEGLRFGHAFGADHARRLYEFITTCMRTPDGWYTSLRDGELYNAAGLDTYYNLFAVIGMARYAQAIGDPKVLAEAERLLLLIEDKTMPGDLATQGLLGLYGDARGWRSTSGMYSGDVVLHYLEALACLCDAGTKVDTAGRAAQIREFFNAKVLDRERMVIYGWFRGSFDAPYNTPGAHTSLGHALEWIDFFRCFPGLELDEEVERGLLQKSIDHGIGADGHYQNNYYLVEGRTAGVGEFWPHVEAIKTLNLAYAVHGAPYDDYFRLMARYYFERYVDDDGSVFSEIDRNGVVVDRCKGGMWKCDYHNVRMCIDVMTRDGGVLDKE
jgi:mannobiose 2-epimerase